MNTTKTDRVLFRYDADLDCYVSRDYYVDEFDSIIYFTFTGSPKNGRMVAWNRRASEPVSLAKIHTKFHNANVGWDDKRGCYYSNRAGAFLRDDYPKYCRYGQIRKNYGEHAITAYEEYAVDGNVNGYLAAILVAVWFAMLGHDNGPRYV